MSKPLSFDAEGEIIDINPSNRRSRRWRWWLLLIIVLLLISAGRAVSIYVSALWFGSLGYSQVYWYMFRLKVELFVVFLILTTAILRGGFWLIERAFGSYVLERRTVFINRQPVNISPARVLRPLAWIFSIIGGLIFGLAMRASWRRFALYSNQAPTDVRDPVFHKSLGFYLFTLPIHQTISEWLVYVSFIILCGALVYAVLAFTQQATATATVGAALRKTSIATVSCALAAWLIILAWRVFLSRYPYLWDDHQTFSGVTFLPHLVMSGAGAGSRRRDGCNWVAALPAGRESRQERSAHPIRREPERGTRRWRSSGDPARGR